MLSYLHFHQQLFFQLCSFTATHSSFQCKTDEMEEMNKVFFENFLESGENQRVLKIDNFPSQLC